MPGPSKRIGAMPGKCWVGFFMSRDGNGPAPQKAGNRVRYGGVEGLVPGPATKFQRPAAMHTPVSESKAESTIAKATSPNDGGTASKRVSIAAAMPPMWTER